MDANASHESSEDDVDAPGLPDRLLRKAETAVLGRTSRILCVIERCTDEHNYSAVLRTAEALGVQNVWLVDPVVREAVGELGGSVDHAPGVSASGAERDKATNLHGFNRGKKREHNRHGSDWREQHKLFARRAQEFTSIREFPNAETCVAALRKDGRTIWATDLSQHAVPLTETALREATKARENQSVVPEKLAIVFGTESVGCTETIFKAADLRVYLPLRGFADSLNLSVAAALVMQELFHLCPEAVGDASPQERNAIREKWFTQLAAARALTKSEEKRLKLVESTLRRRGVDRNGRAEAECDPGRTATRDSDLASPSTAALLEELRGLEKKRDERARETAAPYLLHPPRPLRDMRRSDEHREAFVGKNTRQKNAEHWVGMPAVTHYPGAAETRD